MALALPEPNGQFRSYQPGSMCTSCTDWRSSRPREPSGNEERKSIEATITFPYRCMPSSLPWNPGLMAAFSRPRRNARARPAKPTRAHWNEGRQRYCMKKCCVASTCYRSDIFPGCRDCGFHDWAMTLTNINGRGRLRIPLTVGEIYGRSGLPDSDDLIAWRPGTDWRSNRHL